MSCNYNSLLKPYNEKGNVGAEELLDTPEEIEYMSGELYGLIHNSRSIVVLTGAGISTAAGIPDFRGPNGVWTLEKAGKVPDGVDLQNAKPTYSHRFLVELEKLGKVDYLITQNIDDLHRKSGFPVEKMAELHGNLFKEQCNQCKRIVYRDFVINSVGFKETGRKCELNERGKPCRGKFFDMSLDWDDALPKEELKKCYEMLQKCDVILCLGTTLQINPVGEFPLYAIEHGSFAVSVNLQKTKHEEEMRFAIHAKIDDVCRILTDKMEMYIPEMPIDTKSKRKHEDSYEEEDDVSVGTSSAKKQKTVKTHSLSPAKENEVKPQENAPKKEEDEKKPSTPPVITLDSDDEE